QPTNVALKSAVSQSQRARMGCSHRGELWPAMVPSSSTSVRIVQADGRKKCGGRHVWLVSARSSCHFERGRGSMGKEFVETAVQPAQAAQSEFGVPASITLAQAILESGWGDKHMGNANNYF